VACYVKLFIESITFLALEEMKRMTEKETKKSKKVKFKK